MRLIEFVCSANRSRSVIAELIAKNYLSENGITSHKIISSGIDVDKIQAVYKDHEEMPKRFSKTLLTILIDHDRQIFSSEKLSDIRYLLADSDNLEGERLSRFKQYAFETMEIFDKEELEYRALALEQLGISGIPKSYSEQTVPHDDVDLVLAMSPRHLDFIKHIYSNGGPIISTITDYSGDDVDSVHVGYGQGLEGYLANISILKNCVYSALDKFFDK